MFVTGSYRSQRPGINVYGTTQMSVNDHEFASDTVAVIEQFILFIIAFKLVYYESGRKWFVLAYDLVSSISYVVAGGAVANANSRQKTLSSN